MPEQSKTVPLSALRFAADLELGDNGETAKTVPVRIKARSAQPVHHWYFGRIVHDMAGLRLHKERIPIDYCHDDREVMGFANQFDTANGLVASGALTPFADQDRASEVIFKAKHQVPYEASIFFDPDNLVLEHVPEGMSVAVNGFQFEGPGMVARQWSLRGLAVCPYGQDRNTAVEFSASNGPEVTVKVTETQPATTEEAAPAAANSQAVSDTPAAEAPATDAAAVETAAAETPVAETAQPSAAVPVEAAALGAGSSGQAFLTAFGDKGGVWFAQGKSFSEAQTLFTQEISADRDRLAKENEQLKTHLAAVRGERDPVSFGGDAEAIATVLEPTAKQKAALGTGGLARFAANIKFTKRT